MLGHGKAAIDEGGKPGCLVESHLQPVDHAHSGADLQAGGVAGLCGERAMPAGAKISARASSPARPFTYGATPERRQTDLDALNRMGLDLLLPSGYPAGSMHQRHLANETT